MAWISNHWKGALGALFLVWSGLRVLVTALGDLDLIISRSQDPGWVGVVIDHLLNPPGWALLILLAAGVGLIFWDRRSERSPSDFKAAPAKFPVKAHLTQDQRDFRVALKQFAISWPAVLQHGVGRVFRIVKDREKELHAGSPHSVALHFYYHFATSGNLRGVNDLLDLSKVDIDDIDVEKVQKDILAFLNDYEWRQAGLGTCNDITRLDLTSLDEMKEWLEADKDCRTEYRKLSIWPEATHIKQNVDDKWASTGKAWAAPRRVNY